MPSCATFSRRPGISSGWNPKSQNPTTHHPTHIGRHPILVMRSAEGKVGAFLNTCRHRGTIVCPFKQGRQKFHVCRYHGWAYDSAGRNISVTEEASGQYPPSFSNANHESHPGGAAGRLPRLSVCEPVGGGAADREISRRYPRLLRPHRRPERYRRGRGRAGASTYTFDGNWKLQFENGLDYYHFATTHSSYVDILKKRNATAGAEAGFTAEPADETEGQGSFSFDYGHAVNWSIKRTQLYGRPLGMDPARLEAVRQRGRPHARQMDAAPAQPHHLPNLQVIDILSAQVRTWRPLAPDKTEMVSHCLAPVARAPRRVRCGSATTKISSTRRGSQVPTTT